MNMRCIWVASGLCVEASSAGRVGLLDPRPSGVGCEAGSRRAEAALVKRRGTEALLVLHQCHQLCGALHTSYFLSPHHYSLL